MKLPLLISAGAVLLSSVYSQCNVQSPEIAADLETIFTGNLNQFNNNELNILPGSARNGGGIRIVSANAPNKVAGFWVVKKERLSDGFSATFNFQISGGDSDGLAFVVQNDRIVNSLGDGGSRLGTSESLDNYLMVAFDTCVDRDQAQCTQQEVVVETRRASNQVIQRQTETLAIDLTAGTHDVRVDYLDNTQTVEVSVDGTLITTKTLNARLETLLGGKFAHVGFTASNVEFGNIQAANVQVNNLDIVQMISGFRFEEKIVPTRVDFDDFVDFNMLLVDSCNERLAEGAAPPAATTLNQIKARLIGDSGLVLENAPDVTINQIAGSNTAFAIGFSMVNGILDTFTLDVTVNDVQVQTTPFDGAVTTEVPKAGGIGAVGIGILSSLLVALVVGLVLISYGLRKYRKKLHEHAEDIEYGRTKQKIDTIEKDIEYSPNPMIAPLEVLRERLAANEAEIQRLKEGQRDQMDDNFTVEQLQKENERLREEMNELKRKQDFEAAGMRISTNMERRQLATGNGKNKATFGQEEA